MGMIRLLKEIEKRGGGVRLQHVAVKRPILDDDRWQVTLNYQVGQKLRRVTAADEDPQVAKNIAADMVLADIAPEALDDRS